MQYCQAARSERPIDGDEVSMGDRVSDNGSPSDTPQPARRRALSIAAAILSTVLLVGMFEVACQVYARLVVFPRLEANKENPRHYYRAADNPILGYELQPDSEVMHEGRTLHINRFGLREDSDDLAVGKRRVAILGDSVVFGVSHSQENTIPALVQQQLETTGERVKVLNFSVGGYALAQLLAQLRDKNEIYDVDDVVYLLNFNDFARHDSTYEGADNGLYRTYVRPTFMSPFFVRKAIYRLKKGEKNGSVGWYRWFYEGNEERGQEILSRMAQLGKTEGFNFGVVLLPSGLSFEEDGYMLTDLHERMRGFLEKAGIPYLDPLAQMERDVDRYWDPTDHFHEAGNREIARVIASLAAEMAATQ
jgi:lysophospholipase L1-like esterase